MNASIGTKYGCTLHNYMYYKNTNSIDKTVGKFMNLQGYNYIYMKLASYKAC